MQYKSLDVNIEPDLDNYLNNGYYETTSFAASLFQHAPSGINNSNEAILRVRRIYAQSSLVEQVLFVNNECRYYVRRKRNSWDDWKEMTMDMPTFYKNYSSINSLIDAVNPFRTINMLGETDSWDNLTNGVYCFANTHAGADVAFGFMIQYGYQSDIVIQFAVGIIGIAKRYNIGNGWEEWSYSSF